MTRAYAGILGPIGLLTSLVHGLVHGSSTDANLIRGWYSLMAFAAVGAVLGWIAERAVKESVVAVVEKELAQSASERAGQSMSRKE